MHGLTRTDIKVLSYRRWEDLTGNYFGREILLVTDQNDGMGEIV